MWFRDPQGQLAVYEKVTYEHDAVLRYESVQHQIGERPKRLHGCENKI